MNHRPLVVAALLLSWGGAALPAAAQKTIALQEQNSVGAYRLGVGFSKTTHLVFPHAVTYVDLGSGDIIAAKAQSADNIVKVKAAKQGFGETNMTVLTSDGKLYSFLVNYEANPRVLTVDLGATGGATAPASATASAASSPNPEATSPQVQMSNITIPESDLENFSKVSLDRSRSGGNSETKNDVVFALRGIFTQDDAFFFHLFVHNKTNIGYDIDFIKFYVQDKKVVKRTAEQEQEQRPIYVYNGQQSKVAGKAELDKVFVFKKFTFPDDKNLIIEMFEKGGGRHVTLTISNADVLHAKVLKKS